MSTLVISMDQTSPQPTVLGGSCGSNSEGEVSPTTHTLWDAGHLPVADSLWLNPDPLMYPAKGAWILSILRQLWHSPRLTCRCAFVCLKLCSLPVSLGFPKWGMFHFCLYLCRSHELGANCGPVDTPPMGQWEQVPGTQWRALLPQSSPLCFDMSACDDSSWLSLCLSSWIISSSLKTGSFLWSLYPCFVEWGIT